MPMPEENYLITTNYVICYLTIDIYQKSVTYFENMDASNNYGNFPPFYVLGSSRTEIYINGFIGNNTGSNLAVMYLQIGQLLDARNIYLERSDAVNELIVESSYFDTIKMDNITVNNNDISNINPTGIFFGELNGGSVELSNIFVTNSNIGAKHVFEYRQSSTGTIKMENVHVENVTLGTDTKILKAQSLTSFEMNNCSFSNVHPSDSGDSSPKFIELGSLVLVDQSSYTITDTYFEQSTVGLIELSNIESSDALSASFTLNNLTYVDSYFEFSQDLVSFTGIETSNNFSITLNDFNIQNITFVRTGNLMVLGHQTSTTLEVTNAYFQNVKGAQILIESSNLQNSDLLTKVSMTNMTASSISGSSNSLITVNEGGRLHLSDSTFSLIDNTERGAVLNAGYQNSQTEVHNTTFTENMSIYGGVANVQDSSVIKFYNCNFTNNFAVQSGVIQASSDGYYEFYQSYITNNYAYTLSISEIFIVSQISMFSNSSIFGNLVLSKDQITSEFDSCSLL